jgi:hypothetical protein
VYSLYFLKLGSVILRLECVMIVVVVVDGSRSVLDASDAAR